MEIDLIVILGFFSFWMGACIASFLNVVIWRVPRGESIVRPPSHCPKCNAAIKWYQNIPIIAWLALRGKCANCKAPISPRYILIETLGGILFLAVFLSVMGPYFPHVDQMIREGFVPYADMWTVLVLWIWVSLMIVGSFIDFDLQLLPDFVTVGGMILGVVNAAVSMVCELVKLQGSQHAAILPFIPLIWSISGLAFGFGLLWLVRWLGSIAFKREAMGMGDVFLMGAIGALFGPAAVLVTLILSSVFGSVVGIGLIALSKAKLGKFIAIPFGPYICMGCLTWMFFGEQLVGWYLNLLGVK